MIYLWVNFVFSLLIPIAAVGATVFLIRDRRRTRPLRKSRKTFRKALKTTDTLAEIAHDEGVQRRKNGGQQS
jgi:hypothetical protein